MVGDRKRLLKNMTEDVVPPFRYLSYIF